MAGMPGAAVAARNGVMVASLAVIVLMGGRALFGEPRTAPASASLPPRSSPGAVTVPEGPSPSVRGVAAGAGTLGAAAGGAFGAGAAGPDGVAIPTAVTLERADEPQARRGRITLQGRLTVAGTAEPVDGTVTLWRRTPSRRWKPIIRNRATAASGLVLLEVQQSGARSVYRLTFATDGVHAAAASAPLAVRR